VYNWSFLKRFRAIFLFLSALLIILSACGEGNITDSNAKGTPILASSQVLIFPNVGTQDIGILDPALQPDANSAIVTGMIYSGLVRFDKNLHIVPDQASSWTISPDNKTYTFKLKSGISFSDGTPVTAQTYVYTLTRALSPEVQSGFAQSFLAIIAGAGNLISGKTKFLRGVKAINDNTLQIRLTQPAAYFLQLLATSFCFPVNEKIISQYGQKDWVNYVAGNGIGTGPFMIKEWIHNLKMILVPNPHWYGAKTKLKEVDMLFENDQSIAFKSFQAGHYAFDWNIDVQNIPAAKGMAGFTSKSLLQTDVLFFNNRMPPFDNETLRQAFAYATDKTMLVNSIFKDAAIPAPTIIPPGMPGYQAGYQGLPFDKNQALSALQAVYPDVSKVPAIIFTFPNSEVSSQEASILQQMWFSVLGIRVRLLPMELTAYNNEVADHQVKFGFTQWTADFPDPYDWLALNLLSTAAGNYGLWSNPQYDQLVMQAEQATGNTRIQYYEQAEQLAITDVGWLPLNHQLMAAVIPSWVHGVSLNNMGLYFGDWSDVYLLQH
jgi:oligopeptide transport system substrate-binding protein